MDKTWKVILAFVGIFAAGVVSGTLLGMRFGHQLLPRDRNAWAGGNFNTQMMERLEKELALTPEQSARVRPIIDRAHLEVQRLRKENVQQMTQAMDTMHSEISAVLTPGQRVKQEELRRRLRERYERIRRENRWGDRPPRD